MTLVQRVDHYQQTHPHIGLPIAVIYKLIDDQGTYLAALITYYAIVSLFPLLLLLSTILGFVLKGNPQLQQDVLNSAFAQFPVVGDTLKDPRGYNGTGVGLIVGILGTLYGGLGAAQALQNAMNTVWRVPRNERPNPFKSRGRSLVLLLVVGLFVLGTTGLSAISSSTDSFGARFGVVVRILLAIGAVVINASIFTLAFRVATARDIGLAAIIPGALVAGTAWWALQFGGTLYIGHVVKGATAVNGTFAVILGLIAWIFLEALIVVLAAEFNVVRALRLYPRSLLTPFTDAVELTPADRIAYSTQAKAQQAKGFETVIVHFDKHPPVAPDGARHDGAEDESVPPALPEPG